jgi:LPXTG-site transpeptidase (sortase) family protein
MTMTVNLGRPNRFKRGATHLSLLVVTLMLTATMAATVTAQAPIESTRTGEMPTSGGLRPGPIGLNPIPAKEVGVAPVSIQIERAGVNAEIEALEIVDGKMLDPSGPWIVSWYKDLAKIGEFGNAVMAGHVDYWDVGPAVFYTVGQLQPGDLILVTGENQEIYTYEVEWVQNYDADNAPISEIVGDTGQESLTLITCGGPFDYETGHYLQRTVVRAHRVTTQS